MNIKKISFIGLFATFFTSLYAIDNNLINFNIKTQSGILHGNISEYVYEEPVRNTDHLESQLDWDILAVPYIEETVSILVLNHITASFNGRFGFPCNSGNMQDYDWLNSFRWPTEDPTELTNYSIHDNYLDQYYLLSGSLGFSLPLKQNFGLLTAYASYEYEFVSFTGSNGYSTYKSNDWKEKNFNGKVIAYKQESNSVFFGFQANIKPLNHFNISLDIRFSPELTFINAIDYHLINRTYNGTVVGGTAYLDEISNCNQIKIDFSLAYNFNNYHQIGLNCGIQSLPVSKGSDSQRFLDLEGDFVTYSKWIKTTATGGTSRTLWNFGLTYTLSF